MKQALLTATKHSRPTDRGLPQLVRSWTRQSEARSMNQNKMVVFLLVSVSKNKIMGYPQGKKKKRKHRCPLRLFWKNIDGACCLMWLFHNLPGPCSFPKGRYGLNDLLLGSVKIGYHQNQKDYGIHVNWGDQGRAV